MANCRDCGFLTLREHFTQAIVEAPWPYRKEGKAPQTITKPRMEQCERLPVCYEDLRSFSVEITHMQKNLGITAPPSGFEALDIDPGIVNPYVAYVVLNKIHDCPSFVEYRQGMSPQGHRDMVDRRWKIKQEILVREAVWAREDERDARVNAREDARDKREDGRDVRIEKRHGTELWVLGWVIAAATLLASIIDATATCKSTNTVVIREQVVPTAAAQQTP